MATTCNCNNNNTTTISVVSYLSAFILVPKPHITNHFYWPETPLPLSFHHIPSGCHNSTSSCAIQPCQNLIHPPPTPLPLPQTHLMVWSQSRPPLPMPVLHRLTLKSRGMILLMVSFVCYSLPLLRFFIWVAVDFVMYYVMNVNSSCNSWRTFIMSRHVLHDQFLLSCMTWSFSIRNVIHDESVLVM